jgi:hypothetical protein
MTPSNRDAVQFTRESAERIANVVRAAETAPRPARPLVFAREDFFRGRKTFRVCTFTGSWSINGTKTVTFKNQTTTPNTASVVNLFFPITNTAAITRDCGIAQDGTAWYLIDVPLATATAVFASRTATATVFGTGSTSVINFFSPGSTSVINFFSPESTSQLTFVTGVSASLNTTDCTITVTAETATATSISMGGTQTATSISMGGTQTAISVSMSGTQTLTVIQTTFTATFLTFG